MAKNQNDNFMIHYYENEQDMKEKGSFDCCGFEIYPLFLSQSIILNICIERYQAEFFTSEDTALYGAHGIKLKPFDDSKRIWLFRADNDDEQNQWLEARNEHIN